MEVIIGSYRIAVERIPFSPMELRQRYDRLASRWGKLVERLGFADAYQLLFQQIRSDGYFDRLVDCHPAVLDCGIGAGDLSLALNDVLKGDSQVDGIDISAEMLAQASKRLDAGGPGARLHQATIEHLPFPRRRFDVVMSAHTLEHLPSLDGALDEMMRVAKPNATLLIVVTQPGLWGRWIQHRWRIKLLTARALKTKLNQLGLTEIRSYPLSGSIWSTNGSVALVGRLSFAHST